MIIQTKF